MTLCLHYDNMLSFLSHHVWQLPSHPVTPSSKHSDSKPIPLTPAYHTLPHPSHHGTPHTTINWGPLEPPKTPKPWSLSCLRPAPPLRPSAALCYKEVRCSSQEKRQRGRPSVGSCKFFLWWLCIWLSFNFVNLLNNWEKVRVDLQCKICIEA